MTRHPKYLERYENPEDLARDLEDTDYEYQVEFLRYYADKHRQRSNEDFEKQRKKVALGLCRVVIKLIEAKQELSSVEKICRPHMNKN